MNQTLSLFVKSPEPGKVKTRMQVLLTAAQCAELASALIIDSATMMQGVPVENRVVVFAPTHAESDVREVVGSGFDFYPQSDGDLGGRMAAEFERAFSNGADQAIIIGADSPTLPAQWIKNAFDFLNTYDLVLGPTYDFGYYLIGMKTVHYALFQSIPWGTDKVLSSTLGIVEKLGLRMQLLPPWYDLDTPEDLNFFQTHLRGLQLSESRTYPHATAKFLSTIPIS